MKKAKMSNPKKIFKKMNQKKNIKFLIIGAVSSILIFLLFGIPTATIPTRFYTRMLPATKLDIFFLIASSLMLGIYIALFFYLKSAKKTKKSKKKNNSPNNPSICAGTGAVGSFLAASCPICIQLLVILFGTATMLTYFDPLRPYIGFLSLALIGWGIHREIQTIKNYRVCGTK